MEKTILIIAVIVLITIVIFTSNKTTIPKTENKTELINELNKLGEISFQRNLTTNDTEKLEELIKSQNNSDLQNEFDELKWMIQHDIQEHAKHSLNSLYDDATGQSFDCPADPLTHIGIYLQYNETNLAKDALKEAQKQLPNWQEQAKKAKSQNNQLYPNLEQIIQLMNKILQDMNNQDYANAQKDSIKLSYESYC